MSIDQCKKSFQQKLQNHSLAEFDSILSDEEIFGLCDLLGHEWRESPLTPAVVVRSLVYRSLHPDKAIRHVVEALVAHGLLNQAEDVSDSGWCQARSRLPEKIFTALVTKSLKKAMARFGINRRSFGREVYIVDGSTVSMPDEGGLVDTFGYFKGKHGNSRFPVARLVALLHAGTHLIADWRVAPNLTSELELFRELLPSIPPHSIWVGDVYFSTFPDFTFSLRAGVDWVTRLHWRRDPKKLIGAGKRLGKNDWLVTLEVSVPTRRTHADQDLPHSITVRLIRYPYRHRGAWKILWLVTSLLDPKQYPRDEIIALYGLRWGIETHYSYLKTTLELSVLRSKTAKNIHLEIGAIMLAHNLVWMLMHEAGEVVEVPVERISFKGTIQTVIAHADRLRNATPHQRPYRYRAMLCRIAKHRNRHRPGRHEPRLIKRETVRFGYLRTSRKEARRVA